MSDLDFAEAQNRLILKLQQQVATQTAEIEHLKSLLVNTNQLLDTPKVDIVSQLSDTEIIAHEQLRVLKEKSLIQELTYDETKKVSEYFKILNQIKSKDGKSVTEDIPTGNLLDLVAALDKK